MSRPRLKYRYYWIIHLPPVASATRTPAAVRPLLALKLSPVPPATSTAPVPQQTPVMLNPGSAAPMSPPVARAELHPVTSTTPSPGSKPTAVETPPKTSAGVIVDPDSSSSPPRMICLSELTSPVDEDDLFVPKTMPYFGSPSNLAKYDKPSVAPPKTVDVGVQVDADHDPRHKVCHHMF